MKLRKKTYVIGGIVLLATLFTGFGIFGAYGPPKFFHGDFSKHVLKKMDSRVAKLDLSETQTKKYDEIREEVAASLAKGKEERKKFFTRLQSEVNKENPDMEALTSIVKHQLKNMPGFMSGNLDHFAEFYNILDEEQKTQAIKGIRKKINRFGTVLCRN
ncbi:MAG: Spy/CpxP family protein refolding chaperone [Thermodesulfobacteriota bacterium]|nr:Spy/CpxP family protein refolding chaperone [Thermodesulfobacteriota bacterium]